MTFAASVAAAPRNMPDATLYLDGIPVLFGTRSGLALTTSGVITNPSAATLTSNNGIVDIKYEGSTLDYDLMMVKPSSASVQLRIDTAWNRYFERRRAPFPVLTADINESATTLALNDTTGLSGGDIIYVNRETILIGTVASSTSLTLCTRNYAALPNNAAAVHQVGAIISKVPRFLLGRMAELRIWAGGPGVSSTTSSQRIRTLYLHSSPRYNRNTGCWELDFDDAMRLVDRKIAVGFQGSDVEEIHQAQISGSMVLSFTPKVLREFTDKTTDNGALALFTGNDDYYVAPIVSYSGGGTAVNVRALSRITSAMPLTLDPATADQVKNISMRRCYAFFGDPIDCLLKAILSERGDGANGAYDVLFGITSGGTSSTGRLEAGQAECRFGAALRAAFVDVAGIEAMRASGQLPMQVSGWFYALGVKGEESLLDLMNEVAWATNSVIYWNSSQQLSMRPFDAQYASNIVAATLDQSVISEGTALISVDDEADIIHTIQVQCNYDHGRDKYYGEVNMYYLQEKETWRDISGVLKIQRKGLIVDMPGQNFSLMNGGLIGARTTLDSLRMALDSVFARRCYGIRKYRVVLPWKFVTLNPADRVTMTFEQFNDFSGSTVTAATGAFEVVSVSPDFSKGTVEVELHEVFAASLISPTVEIASWNAGTGTATLSTSNKFGTGTSPGNWLANGWVVRLYDFSASPPFSTVNTLVVSALTTTTLQFTFAPSFTPAAGDIITSDLWDNTGSGAANAAQGLTPHDYAHLARVGFGLGAGNDAGKAWG